jgi:hypothetical protein
MRTQFILLAAMIGSAFALVAQEATDSAGNVRMGKRVPLPFGNSIDMVGAPKCDGSGNVYVRPANSAKGDPDEYIAAPIKEVTSEGKLTGTFRLAATMGAGRGIFVDTRGTVYLAGDGPGGIYVVEFAQDGSVKSKTKLETGTYVDPYHVAVLESGRFLVSGESGKDLRTPYTALFEANGKLAKQIDEVEDEDARRKAELGDVEFTHNADSGNMFVQRGDVTSGSDGNVYLLHGTFSPLVYVISPAGKVLRKMRIGADSERLFRGIKFYKGQLAIALSEFGHIEVRVTNLDGTPIRNYSWDSDPAEVPVLACYDAGGFTFVTEGASGSAYMLNARP